jgi:hypothetical protein
MSSLQVVAPITAEEDTFCLGMIEYGGNIAAAYRAAFGSEANMPIARGRELISRPDIAKRIQQLAIAADEHSMVSLGSHLAMLAHIRDMSIEHKQMKVALDSELARAEAAGVMHTKENKRESDEPKFPLVQLVFPGNMPTNVTQWAERQGTAPVVIEAKQ